MNQLPILELLRKAALHPELVGRDNPAMKTLSIGLLLLVASICFAQNIKPKPTPTPDPMIGMCHKLVTQLQAQVPAPGIARIRYLASQPAVSLQNGALMLD